MMRVEVHVPAVGRSYDMALNEHARIPDLIDEIASIVAIREQRQWRGGDEGLILCNASYGLVLPREKTLHQCRVSPGNKLVLV